METSQKSVKVESRLLNTLASLNQGQQQAPSPIPIYRDQDEKPRGTQSLPFGENSFLNFFVVVVTLHGRCDALHPPSHGFIKINNNI